MPANLVLAYKNTDTTSRYSVSIITCRSCIYAYWKHQHDIKISIDTTSRQCKWLATLTLTTDSILLWWMKIRRRLVRLWYHSSWHYYWVIQAGLLTPLTFARHWLSPLAAFTSGAYFLHNGRRWQWIWEFYTANFKGIFFRPVVTMCL